MPFQSIKNYCLPKAQLLRKHLFSPPGVGDQPFTFKKLRLLNHRYRHDDGTECAQVSVGSEQSRATEPQPNNYRRRSSGISTMSQLINLPLHLQYRDKRHVEAKISPDRFSFLRLHKLLSAEFLANCAKYV